MSFRDVLTNSITIVFLQTNKDFSLEQNSLPQYNVLLAFMLVDKVKDYINYDSFFLYFLSLICLEGVYLLDFTSETAQLTLLTCMLQST